MFTRKSVPVSTTCEFLADNGERYERRINQVSRDTVDLPWNSSIICVDDEEGIIEAYKNALTSADKPPGETQNLLSLRRERRKGPQAPVQNGTRPAVSYNILTASSGEQAVEIVRRELAAGRQIAAGFFDMAMPGGMDGSETIREILKLDSQILCAVVTAYADRSPEQIGMAFRRQDDWLYFNKPFSTGEVRQTAYHLVTAWNQRRREELLVSNLEMMQSGLMCILESVSDVNRIPPLVLDSLLEGILKHFLRLLEAKDGFVSLRSDDPEFARLGAGIFGDKGDNSSSAIKEKWPMAEEVMRNRVSLVRGNIAATPLMIGEELLGVLFVQKEKEIVQDPKLLDMYSIQAVNLIQHSKLYEELDRRNLELNKKNQELLDLLGKLTQSEKLRSQFEKLSYIDALTGIPNRRYLEIRINEELARSKRHGFSMACLMMDIDHFKSINDTYGHAAGDHVLKELGELLRNRKRAYDVVGRYGGEEFAVLFKQIDQTDTFTVAERVRAAIERHEFVFEGQHIKVTVSIGIAAVKPSGEDTIISILQKADDALYTAKQNGRNRCILL